MQPTINASLPLVGICNIAEPFYDFLTRAGGDQSPSQLIRGEQYRGDRVLVWFGERKLVYSSFPIPHADDLCRQFGYQATTHLAPTAPTPWLSHDILREPTLLDTLIDYAGPERVVQIVPYATTTQFMELVTTLERDHGLTVLLPESPAPDALWVRDYIDTKVGFRTLASRWLPDADRLLPEGFACHTAEIAARAAAWFLQNKRACILKADDGENGLGNLVLDAAANPTADDILCEFDDHAFLGRQWYTVEELITATRLRSPSFEAFVPPPQAGEPYLTYLSDQVFQDFGDFCGVLVGAEVNRSGWATLLTDAGLTIARQLQQMGYVGHFDMDAVVDDDGRLYLLEINSRRTGGTHVHEFARHVFGANYHERVTLLSNDTLGSGDIVDYRTLKAMIGDLAYPIDGSERGVVIMITSALADREFGCIFVGASRADVLHLQAEVQTRVQQHIVETGD